MDYDRSTRRRSRKGDSPGAIGQTGPKVRVQNEQPRNPARVVFKRKLPNWNSRRSHGRGERIPSEASWAGGAKNDGVCKELSKIQDALPERRGELWLIQHAEVGGRLYSNAQPR